MNSVRQKSTSKVWTPEDFMPTEKKDETQGRIQTDEEIYAMLMKWMPPAQ